MKQPKASPGPAPAAAAAANHNNNNNNSSSRNNNNNSNNNSDGNPANVKPENYQLNAKICRLVERCPCMYDRSHPQYLKKDVVDLAWVKIAKECEDSVASCKERWRNIRTSFARSINVKKVPASANRTKPYYLHEELQFLGRHITPGVPVSRKSNSTSANSAGFYGTKDEDGDADADESGAGGEYLEVAVGEESFDGFAAMVHDTNKRRRKRGYREEVDDDADEEEEAEEADEEEGGADDSSNCERMSSADEVSPPRPVPVPLSQPFEAKELALVPPQGPLETADVALAQLMPPKKRQRNSELSVAGVPLLAVNGGIHEAAEVEVAKPAMTESVNAESADFDAIFLQGLLPELKAMDFRQKLHFKRRIYELMGEIFEGRGPESAVVSPSYSQTPTAGSTSFLRNRQAAATPTLPQNRIVAAHIVPAPPNALVPGSGPGGPMAVVNAADLALIRRLNALLQPHLQAAPGNVAPGMTNAAPATTTLPPPPHGATVAVNRNGAVTRSSANLLRVTMVSPMNSAMPPLTPAPPSSRDSTSNATSAVAVVTLPATSSAATTPTAGGGPMVHINVKQEPDLPADE